ncbi:TetR family transcriptional regulator [Kaistia dalseonensis]|uniref:TetR/AcrR family transcriptional repressor of nem operon n=1 Tax=Kaistia dalseonensis TaxID=410840 RepID=A0ABU0HDH6_9HYPH|nr:TetR family transcriptional regulator [Kaistia dalseonensis]MCX5496945.1 TetR family transcriptional regulator [Kaistia dalseonensis]MDQ0439571.1 TetR/AcrR family transcriptional repressor of nem operon [Kaistia dalseonensis]
MARASREQAEKHREQIVEAASRLFRERGLDGVSVPDLMGAAGLTHGGFYGHFSSKDALAALACAAGFDQFTDRIDQSMARHSDDAEGARQEVLSNYLSAAHRDNPALGCMTAALSIDVARSGDDSAVRKAYTAGVRKTIDELARLSPVRDDDADAAQSDALATMALMVGTILMARATKGDPLSDAIIEAARQRLQVAPASAVPPDEA